MGSIRLSDMRTGEVHGLKWKYVDFDLRIIRVRETFVLGEDEYTKTDGSQRDIQMSQPVFEALKSQWEATGKTSEYVFCNLVGEPLDNKNFSDRVWYPIVYMDCIHVKVRDNGAVRVKALYLAIGVNLDGIKEVLGLWMAQTEGAKFWLQVVTELRNRGVADIFIACVDGLKGFPDAIESVFPKTAVQLCLVHMVRHSLNFVGWKQRKEVAADLRLIYAAPTESEAERQLTEFEAKWDASYAPIGQSWRRNWSRLIPFFDYPPDIRKVIYTTNAIESVNMSLRKITKTRGSFPTDDAVFKLFYLALNNISQKWTMPIRDWKAALNRFTIQFDERMPRV